MKALLVPLQKKKNVDDAHKKRSTIILGDSLLKDIEQTKLRKGIRNREKVFVKVFSGSTTKQICLYYTAAQTISEVTNNRKRLLRR